MNLSQLAEGLSFQFQYPQKSERWAMYRLIMPVVDFAEAASPRTVHFEYNQTSLHGTSQSVDIALLNDATEEVFLEAKRIDRLISSDQISKYMKDGVRGLVSNGIDWILCMEGQSRRIRIYDPDRRNVNQNGLEDIIGFIRNPPTTAKNFLRPRCDCPATIGHQLCRDPEAATVVPAHPSSSIPAHSPDVRSLTRCHA
jgi:hypothetical protein